MTVIAQIPYKDGILVVADSRITIEPKEYSSADDFESKVTYSDGQSKITKSKDGMVVTADGGDVLIDCELVSVIIGKSSGLEGINAGNRQGLDEVNAELDNVMAAINGSKTFGGKHGIVLATVKCTDGSIRSLISKMRTTSDAGTQGNASARLVDMKLESPAGYAAGPDIMAQDLLKYFVNMNCPDASKRTMEDAMAAAIMLENYYINQPTYENTKYGKAKISTVGGPITMTAVQKDKDLDVVMGKTEMSIMEGKDFKEVKEFIVKKLGWDREVEEFRKMKAAGALEANSESPEHQKSKN
jgi:hypothetical protein